MFPASVLKSRIRASSLLPFSSASLLPFSSASLVPSSSASLLFSSSASLLPFSSASLLPFSSASLLRFSFASLLPFSSASLFHSSSASLLHFSSSSLLHLLLYSIFPLLPFFICFFTSFPPLLLLVLHVEESQFLSCAWVGRAQAWPRPLRRNSAGEGGEEGDKKEFWRLCGRVRNTHTTLRMRRGLFPSHAHARRHALAHSHSFSGFLLKSLFSPRQTWKLLAIRTHSPSHHVTEEIELAYGVAKKFSCMGVVPPRTFNSIWVHYKMQPLLFKKACTGQLITISIIPLGNAIAWMCSWVGTNNNDWTLLTVVPMQSFQVLRGDGVGGRAVQRRVRLGLACASMVRVVKVEGGVISLAFPHFGMTTYVLCIFFKGIVKPGQVKSSPHNCFRLSLLFVSDFWATLYTCE